MGEALDRRAGLAVRNHSPSPSCRGTMQPPGDPPGDSFLLNILSYRRGAMKKVAKPLALVCFALIVSGLIALLYLSLRSDRGRSDSHPEAEGSSEHPDAEGSPELTAPTALTTKEGRKGWQVRFLRGLPLATPGALRALSSSARGNGSRVAN